jgi:hypothetical protein
MSIIYPDIRSNPRNMKLSCKIARMGKCRIAPVINELLDTTSAIALWESPPRWQDNASTRDS